MNASLRNKTLNQNFQGEIPRLRLYNGKGFPASEELNKRRYDGSGVSEADVAMDKDSSIGALWDWYKVQLYLFKVPRTL